MPAGLLDEPASGAVGRDLVRRRLNRGDLEASLVVGNDRSAEVAVGDVRSEMGVVAFVVRVPEFDGCTAQPLAVEIANLALEDQLRSNLVVTHRKFTLGRQRLGIGNVVRALDASLGAVLAAVRNLLDVVLEEDVQPQGPLAELADVDEPLLEDAVLG